ncbi:MAG: flagellar basal-body rod protein FlgC [Verrucomicrobiales bacterium]|jgi:flagellar basal-body rod protein FlgC|nr:flagellar basal-body rod protein FlgC [Verrucomicrobiales bacterium]MDB6131147.1 flagellar basal-body rod protein FlgC [Verrucomicrobiales bacterium]
MIQLLSGINSTSSALEAERVRMDIVSQNIANANTTRGVDGKPYQRQEVVFETALNQQMGANGGTIMPGTVRVARIQHDTQEPRMVYNPTHPDANADGMVGMPNINIHEEMVDLIASSRSFEANLAVIKNARSMAVQSLSIGKH